MTAALFAMVLAAAPACAGAQPQTTTTPTPAASPAVAMQPTGMQIKLTTIFVDDQDKALHFYTDVLGFVKKDDVSNNGYRWLTVVAPDNKDGAQLQLASAANPAGKAFQQALYQQKQPAVMFYTDNIKRDYETIMGKGGRFAMPPTDITYSWIAQLDDTCGNMVQITQLANP